MRCQQCGRPALCLVDPDFDPNLDANGDEAVGIPDFNTLREFFGGPPGPSGLACAGTIPCPAKSPRSRGRLGHLLPMTGAPTLRVPEDPRGGAPFPK